MPTLRRIVVPLCLFSHTLDTFSLPFCLRTRLLPWFCLSAPGGRHRLEGRQGNDWQHQVVLFGRLLWRSVFRQAVRHKKKNSRARHAAMQGVSAEMARRLCSSCYYSRSRDSLFERTVLLSPNKKISRLLRHIMETGWKC